MAEYIEREAVIVGVEKRIKNPVIIGWLSSIIAEIPSADVVPVRHGRWVELDHGLVYKCYECGNLEDIRLSKYCPKCGAHMKDGEDDGENETN